MFFSIDVYVYKFEYPILNNKINSGDSLWNEKLFNAILKRTLSIYVFLFIFNFLVIGNKLSQKYYIIFNWIFKYK